MTEQRAADAAATVSVGLAGISWLADLAFVLQVLATIIAGIAGLLSIRAHFKRKKQEQ